MKNGIYFFLILFLGILGYFVVNDLYKENSITLASGFFLAISATIVYLATHFKKKTELSPAQKVIGVIYISLLSLYGISVGISLVGPMEATALHMEGAMFLVGALALLYGVMTLMRRHSYHNGHFI